MAIRASWIRRMLLVFVRSRAGNQTVAARSAAASCAWVASSAATAARTSAAVARRSADRADWWASGEAASGARRMRSMAARASSGRVSHVGERVSHSFGPREP